jgi:hypothetical protein
VIARYLRIQEQLEGLPLSSVEITPANYRFHYKGEVGTGSALAYVYQITPRKKQAGLIRGELWIDSGSGAAILQARRFVKTPSPFLGRIDIVRDTQLLEGNHRIRTTHLSFETRAGRGELTTTEIPLSAPEQEHRLKSVPLARN